MTRAEWYAQKHGGGWRKARKAHRCPTLGCFRLIEKGDQYFDTCKPTEWPKTLRICDRCANEPLKETVV